MEREYIKISSPSVPFSTDTTVLKAMDNSFWKNWVFYHLLVFYKNFSKEAINEIISKENAKPYRRIEDEIAKHIRNHLKNDRLFALQGFLAKGGIVNDEEKMGIYDISVLHSYWKNNDTEISFNFECKNLDKSQDLINKYVCYNQGKTIYDGGVYRYFNGKYALNQNFGGMIGFALDDTIPNIKSKLTAKLKDKFDTSPNGDCIRISDNSIENNSFTFDSFHVRNDSEFCIHHLIFDFTSQ